MDDFTIRRQRHRPSSLDHTPDILTGYFSWTSGDGSHSLAVGTPHMRTREIDKNMLDLTSSHDFSLGHTLSDGFNGGRQIHDRTPFEPPGICNPKADRVQPCFALHSDQRADFGGADVQAYNDLFSASHTTFCSSEASGFIFKIGSLNRKSTCTASGNCCWMVVLN